MKMILKAEKIAAGGKVLKGKISIKNVGSRFWIAVKRKDGI